MFSGFGRPVENFGPGDWLSYSMRASPISSAFFAALLQPLICLWLKYLQNMFCILLYQENNARLAGWFVSLNTNT